MEEAKEIKLTDDEGRFLINFIEGGIQGGAIREEHRMRYTLAILDQLRAAFPEKKK